MAPNDETHPAFGEAVRRAAAAGVKILAVDCLGYPGGTAGGRPGTGDFRVNLKKAYYFSENYGSISVQGVLSPCTLSTTKRNGNGKGRRVYRDAGKY